MKHVYKDHDMGNPQAGVRNCKGKGIITSKGILWEVGMDGRRQAQTSTEGDRWGREYERRDEEQTRGGRRAREEKNGEGQSCDEREDTERQTESGTSSYQHTIWGESEESVKYSTDQGDKDEERDGLQRMRDTEEQKSYEVGEEWEKNTGTQATDRSCANVRRNGNMA